MNDTEYTKQLDLNFEASLPVQDEPCRLPPFLMKDGFYFIALGGAEKSRNEYVCLHFRR